MIAFVTNFRERGVAPIEAGQPASTAKVELGRMLFFDKILSGNKDVSCATLPPSGATGR